VPVVGTIVSQDAEKGLCGGFVFTVMDRCRSRRTAGRGDTERVAREAVKGLASAADSAPPIRR
jgi:hypothetical protein